MEDKHDNEACWRFIQHERELREQWQKEHEERHKMEAAAVNIARATIDNRLEGMNELRDQIITERGHYVSRDLHDKLEENIGKRIEKLDQDLDKRLRILEDKSSNLEGRLWMVGAMISGVTSIVVIAVNLLLYYFTKR